jgi:hypothetical protein
MPASAETLRQRAAKLIEDAEQAEFEEYRASRVDDVMEAVAAQVADLRARRDSLQRDDDERARLTASLAHVDATLAEAIDTYESGRLELRTAMLAGSDDLLTLQTVSTSNLLTVRGLEESREEVAQMLANVPAPDGNVADIDEQIARLTSADPLDLVDEVIEREDEADARHLAELERGAIAWNANHPYVSPDLAAHLAREKQEKRDKLLNNMPYTLNPWDAAELAQRER